MILPFNDGAADRVYSGWNQYSALSHVSCNISSIASLSAGVALPTDSPPMSRLLTCKETYAVGTCSAQWSRIDSNAGEFQH